MSKLPKAFDKFLPGFQKYKFLGLFLNKIKSKRKNSVNQYNNNKKVF